MGTTYRWVTSERYDRQLARSPRLRKADSQTSPLPAMAALPSLGCVKQNFLMLHCAGFHGVAYRRIATELSDRLGVGAGSSLPTFGDTAIPQGDPRRGKQRSLRPPLVWIGLSRAADSGRGGTIGAALTLRLLAFSRSIASSPFQLHLVPDGRRPRC